MNKFLYLWRAFWSIAFIKTIWYNFCFLSLTDAIVLPILVYRHTKIVRMDGKISFGSPLAFGMVRLGHYVIGTQDERYSDTVLELAGNLIFAGSACVGRGTKISVGQSAKLTLGDKLTINGDCEIYCHHDITIGDQCVLSWNILIMDTDFHAIYEKETKKRVNNPNPVRIGNHVWIGCRCTILKGTAIPDNSIISANSLLSKEFSEEWCVIGGIGNTAGVIRRNVEWVN